MNGSVIDGAASPCPQPEPAPMLIREASRLLENMYDPGQGLFSYSTRLRDGAYENAFDHPARIRYTINALCGIQKACRCHPLPWNVPELIESFLSKQLSRVAGAADKGLLLYLLAEADHEERHARVRELARFLGDEAALARCDLQDASWMASGLSAHARLSGSDEARRLAARAVEFLERFAGGSASGLPRHRLRGFRSSFTSFGGIAYRLWALSEHALCNPDAPAGRDFLAGVQAIVRKQGPRGEWAWFYDNRSGAVVDWYQLYSVHQDAMAMLFLLPAKDKGFADAEGSVTRSLRWLLGANQLRRSMVTRDPFFVCRSIRRRGRWERERRLLRAFTRGASRRDAGFLPDAAVEINAECRSYHIGWVLYAWAGREDFRFFTSLAEDES